MPAAARSRAACMPPIPPPTTRAAPTGWVWGASDGIGNNLLGGRLLPGSLLDRLKFPWETGWETGWRRLLLAMREFAPMIHPNSRSDVAQTTPQSYFSYFFVSISFQQVRTWRKAKYWCSQLFKGIALKCGMKQKYHSRAGGAQKTVHTNQGNENRTYQK